ncbi:pyrimidine 5-nucleotidase [Cadophora sp. DSE1049]|nr:pyrimidine 5-nucleotidase [Cadophora sp. DSE1049]
MEDNRPVFFFDVDNCLYPRNSKVLEAMSKLIDKYLMNHLSLNITDAQKLHEDYLLNYGLAVEGMAREHKIDPLEFNEKVDDAISLEDLLHPNESLRRLLHDMDKSKVKLWLFTNAYVNHVRRITYCDYGATPMLCKPDERAYAKAMREAGVKNKNDCYFVDDSAANCAKAEHLGWEVAHVVEEGIQAPKEYICKARIQHLEELRGLFPQFFKQ